MISGLALVFIAAMTLITVYYVINPFHFKPDKTTTTITESNITTVIRRLPVPKPLATVQMEFEPLTMKRGESKVITVILNCCLLSKWGNIPDEELGKIKTVKIGMSVSACTKTGKLPEGVTAKFNPEYLTLKLNQTTFSNLTVSVNNTAEFGTCPLYINLYDNNSTPDMYIDSHTPYPGGANFVYFTIIDTGAGGTLTASLSPSLDGKGDIRATSITKAVLSSPDGALPGGSFVISSGGYGIIYSTAYKTATIINGTAQFNLSAGDAGDRFIRINDLNDNLIPTRIDDPTKGIAQFVGQNLRESVIGNLSDPTYRIKTFPNGQGNPIVRCTDGTGVGFDSVYIILSLKTNPQKLEINGLSNSLTSGNIVIISAGRVTNFTPTAPTHPSTSTSINPPFSKWVFGKGSHGDDYGGNDSKCSICHGNLDTKPVSFSEITINNGFCFRCHNGKDGADAGFAGQISCEHPYPTAKPTAIPTAIP